MTACECKQAGFCARHGLNKTARMVHLCQNDQRYFDKWEGEAREPGFWAKAANFGGAVIKHALTGSNVSDDEFNRRKSLCVVCDDYNKDADQCKRCGCNLNLKARWGEQHCPIGKW